MSIYRAFGENLYLWRRDYHTYGADGQSSDMVYDRAEGRGRWAIYLKYSNANILLDTAKMSEQDVSRLKEKLKEEEIPNG